MPGYLGVIFQCTRCGADTLRTGYRQQYCAACALYLKRERERHNAPMKIIGKCANAGCREQARTVHPGSCCSDKCRQERYRRNHKDGTSAPPPAWWGKTSPSTGAIYDGPETPVKPYAVPKPSAEVRLSLDERINRIVAAAKRDDYNPRQPEKYL